MRCPALLVRRRTCAVRTGSASSAVLQAFTGNMLPYPVLGPPAGLEVQPLRLQVRAEAVTPLHMPRRPVALYTVDWYGRRLLDYDRGHRNATAVAPFLPSAPAPVPLTRGFGHAALALRAPRVGGFVVALAAPGLAAAQFYVPGETRCRPCVAGAQCDGGARLRTRADHWRPHNATRRFVRCPPWLPPNTCLAGHEVGACAPHHSGTLCARCVAGHAGTRCDACAAVGAAAQLTAFAVGIGLIFVWTTFRAFQQVPRPTRFVIPVCRAQKYPVWVRLAEHYPGNGPR